MHALLHFQFTELPGNPFVVPWLTEVRQRKPEWTVYDLDAKSDEVAVHYARQLSQAATHLWVSVALDGFEGEWAMVQSVLRPLARKPPVRLVLLADVENPTLHRLFQSLRPQGLHYAPVEAWAEYL